MKVILPLLLLVGLAYMPAIRAQCTTGVDTGGECVPPEDLPGAQQDGQAVQPRQPRVVWADRWGAIAIDDTSSVGVSENQTSKSAATTEALQRCTSKSTNQSCKISLAYYNQCAALAWGTKFESTAGALDVKQAKENALTSCSQGASDCKVVYSACSLPVRVQ